MTPGGRKGLATASGGLEGGAHREAHPSDALVLVGPGQGWRSVQAEGYWGGRGTHWYLSWGGCSGGTERSSTQHAGGTEGAGALWLWGGTGQFKRWCWSNWMSTGEGMNLDLNLAPYKETNSKWIMDLNANVNSKTYSRAQEKIFGKDFLDKSTANI